MADNIVSTDSDGLISRLPNDPKKFFNGVGEWVEIEQTLPDNRPLKALIKYVSTVLGISYTEDTADPPLGAFKVTQADKDILQTAINAAQKVVDEFGENYFSQNDYDNAQNELQLSFEAFKAKGVEVIPNLDTFNSLKARVEAVNNSCDVSDQEGKDILFGHSWVNPTQKQTANTAVTTAQGIVDKAIYIYTESQDDRKQSKIDEACGVLQTATELYESQVTLAQPDFTGINDAIFTAESSINGVVVSEDGEGLGIGVGYVTNQQFLDTMNTAIETAKTEKDEATTQAQLDKATDKMKEATADFLLLVKFTFDWYNIPEDTNWDELPYNSFPTGLDWSRLPWDRIEWTKISEPHTNQFPWDDNLVFDKAAISNGMEKIAESADAMNSISKSIIAKRELMNNNEAIADAGNSSSAIGIGKILTEMIGEDPLTNDMSTLVASAELMEKIFNNERALAAMVASASGMNAVANSQTAMNAVANSQTALTEIDLVDSAISTLAKSNTALTELKKTGYYAIDGTVDTGTVNGLTLMMTLNSIVNVPYSGSSKNVTLAINPHSYKLQVWGAQGGESSDASGSYGYGGKGGYAEGIYVLSQKQTLYLVVGGKGAKGRIGSRSGSAFNGGGVGYGSGNPGNSGGGGGTDITTSLPTFTPNTNYATRRDSSSINNRLLVAGGGGGGGFQSQSNRSTGGYGGGSSGGKGISSRQYIGNPGTQSGGGSYSAESGGRQGEAGSLYYGGSANTSTDTYCGGGGGYYGGSGALDAAAGGSGYVNTNKLSSASTIAGNASFPATTSGNETGHAGDGYARITRTV